MTVRKPNLSSAAVILRKHLAKQGVALSQSKALEIAASMEGYQSYQAFQAQQECTPNEERPRLVADAESDCGADFIYVGPQNSGVWIRIRNINVYIKENDEGVSVDLYDAFMEDQGSQAGAWHLYAEAAESQLEQAEQFDDTKDYIREYCKAQGLSVYEDAESQGLWRWRGAHTSSTGTFESEWQAWSNAYSRLF